MLARFRFALTYANVMATIAVAIALGGSAVALDVIPFAQRSGYATRSGMVDGLHASRLPKKNTLLALNGSARVPAAALPTGLQGPQGAQGAQGIQGPQGEKGDPGTPGAPGLSALETVTANSATDSNSGKSATADCPAGKRPISLTYMLNGSYYTGAYPSAVANVAVSRAILTDTGGLVSAIETTATANPWYVSVWVLCAQVG